MVGFRLKSVSDSEAVYCYYPENDMDAEGVVSYNRSTGARNVVSVAPGDEYLSYSSHLFNRLDEFNESGVFEDGGYVAWY